MALLASMACVLTGCARQRRTASHAPTNAGLTAVTTTATPLPTPRVTPTPERYTVRRGDNLAKIADHYQTTVGALRQANGLSGNLLRAGQEIVIPVPNVPAGSTSSDQSAGSQSLERTETPNASTLGPARIISRGPNTTNAVALTFDAGADVGYTALILDVLRRNGIHATFGMTGQWAQENPDLVKLIAEDGHQLMNHSWDHRSFTGVSTHGRPLSQAQRWDELDRTDSTIKELTGMTTKPYFRAPYGDQNAGVQADIGARGYGYDVLWTVDSHGWAGASIAEILQRSERGAQPGAIYVMHVDSASKDGLALQAVIDAIRAKGLGFETVSQLLGSG